MPVKELPRVLNPEKGYLVTANNRAGGKHSKWHIADTFPSPPRAERITALIEELIAKKKGKIEINDLMAITLDTVDV